MSLFMIYVVYVCLCKGHAPHQVLKFAEHVSLLHYLNPFKSI